MAKFPITGEYVVSMVKAGRTSEFTFPTVGSALAGAGDLLDAPNAHGVQSVRVYRHGTNEVAFEWEA